MEIQTTDSNKQRRSHELIKKLCILTIGGGVVFWATSIVTSLLPIAALYRAAFSNWSMQTVWVDSLLAGTVIAFFVSYTLIRLFGRVPAKVPILKSVILSSIALAIAITLIDVPMLLYGSGDTFYYFLIGAIFNAVRFLLLGAGIGFLYKRLYASARTTTSVSAKPDADKVRI